MKNKEVKTVGFYFLGVIYGMKYYCFAPLSNISRAFTLTA